jgi:hypothetical protein
LTANPVEEDPAAEPAADESTVDDVPAAADPDQPEKAADLPAPAAEEDEDTRLPTD